MHWRRSALAVRQGELSTILEEREIILSDNESAVRYRVVCNDEEQHSIWPVDRAIPDGWRDVGFAGARQACLEYIVKIWPDITPRSVREATAPEPADRRTFPIRAV